MLKVASGATLAKYETQFEERSERYHRSWHLCVQADVRCRSEWVTAERRRQEAFHVKHPHASSFNPRMPWDTILREVADSQAFWYKELLEPALLYERSSGAVAIPAHRVYDHDVAVHDDTFALGSKRKRGNRAKVEAPGKGKGKGKNKNRAAELCYEWNRNAAGCKDPCPQGRIHSCEGCRTLGVRSINCGCGLSPPAAKKGKGSGKGKNP